jgi:hypothetical protein
MNKEDLAKIVEDLHKELQINAPNVSSIILFSDHETGESKYYVSGFIEVQATLIKMLLEKDKVLAANVYLSVYQNEKGS